MITSVEAIYRDGKVELLSAPPEHAANSRVFVTFLPPKTADELATLGITRQQAAEVRARAGAIAEDWDHPGMDVYDEP
jgi:hypothetical protein